MAYRLMNGIEMSTAAGELDDYQGMKFVDLNNVLLSVFPGKE